MIPAQVDVAVIGGGPGGSLAATYLRQKGYRVVLLDKQTHPRHTVGENLIPDFWKYLDLAGATAAVEAEGFVIKAGGLVDWNGKTRNVYFKDFGYQRPSLHVERDRFDYLLLENARSKGVEVYEDVAVQSVAFQGEGQSATVNYHTLPDRKAGTIDCRYVVDASGQSALLGKQLNLREMNDDFRFMSVWGYFKGSDYMGFDNRIHPIADLRETPAVTYVTNLADLGDWGWCWHIIQREEVSVGLVMPVAAARAARGKDTSWEDFFHDQLSRLPRVAKMLENACFVPDSIRVIRNYSSSSHSIAGPGYFMVGDAAGFVDPIFSVGVVLAMHSAYLAAWALDRSIQEPHRAADFRAIYERQVQSRLELAKSMALPGYDRNNLDERKVSEVMHMSSGDALELMQQASAMTARAHNFDAMVSAALGDS